MIYSIALYLYALAVVLVSPFRKKAWLMVKGQWEYFPYFAEKHTAGRKCMFGFMPLPWASSNRGVR